MKILNKIVQICFINLSLLFVAQNVYSETTPLDNSHKSPKVSLIMPVYNTEKYLQQNIESVLNQTLSDFEFIIINDASTDSSWDIVKDYAKKDSRIKMVDLPQNSGPGIARNAGIPHITGEYSIFIDSDDWLAPQMLEKIYNSATSQNVDMLLFDAFSFDEGLQKVITESYHKVDFQYLKQHNLKTFTYKDIDDVHMQFTTRYTWIKLIKSSLIKDNDLHFDEIRAFDDASFITKAILLSKSIGYLEEKLYYFRINRPASNHISVLGEKQLRIVKGLHFAFLEQKKFIQNFAESEALFTSLFNWAFYMLTDQDKYIFAYLHNIEADSDFAKETYALISDLIKPFNEI